MRRLLRVFDQRLHLRASVFDVQLVRKYICTREPSVVVGRLSGIGLSGEHDRCRSKQVKEFPDTVQLRKRALESRLPFSRPSEDEQHHGDGKHKQRANGNGYSTRAASHGSVKSSEREQG